MRHHRKRRRQQNSLELVDSIDTYATSSPPGSMERIGDLRLFYAVQAMWAKYFATEEVSPFNDEHVTPYAGENVNFGIVDACNSFPDPTGDMMIVDNRNRRRTSEASDLT